MIFLSFHFLGNQTNSSINEKTEYERRNNRMNRRHWIQQGGSDHQSEERERNLRLKEWIPAESDQRSDPRTIRPTLRPTNNQTHASIHAHDSFDPCFKLKTHTPTHDSFDPRRFMKREHRIENRGREERTKADHQTTTDHQTTSDP